MHTSSTNNFLAKGLVLDLLSLGWKHVLCVIPGFQHPAHFWAWARALVKRNALSGASWTNLGSASPKAFALRSRSRLYRTMGGPSGVWNSYSTLTRKMAWVLFLHASCHCKFFKRKDSKDTVYFHMRAHTIEWDLNRANALSSHGQMRDSLPFLLYGNDFGGFDSNKSYLTIF